MPAITATAPGKIILYGEHAVVYGRPAIAVPVTQVHARVIVSANPRGKAGQVHVQAPDIAIETDLDELPGNHPIAKAIWLTATELAVQRLPACQLRIVSSIPVASGLGSGAAVTVALIRALSGFLGRRLPDERVSQLVYEVEKLYHGTPSGIDNNVITCARPVYFIREKPVEILAIKSPFTVVIGNTGIRSPTAMAVAELRNAWQTEPEHYESIFTAVEKLVKNAKKAIESGNVEALGPLMDENQALLAQMGVSSNELDNLVQAARDAGAMGAKLSGGGRGGNMIAIVKPELAQRLSDRLLLAGATNTIITEVR